MDETDWPGFHFGWNWICTLFHRYICQMEDWWLEQNEYGTDGDLDVMVVTEGNVFGRITSVLSRCWSSGDTQSENFSKRIKMNCLPGGFQALAWELDRSAPAYSESQATFLRKKHGAAIAKPCF